MKVEQQAGSGNRRTALGLVALVAVMVGLSFAAVPLYRIFCAENRMGRNASTRRRRAGDRGAATWSLCASMQMLRRAFPGASSRSQPKVTLHIGENKLAFFRATNLSKETVTGSAVFNVSPDVMGQYFTKVQCFCFTEQTLKPGEAVEMPVSFFIDPAILQDRDAKTVRDMTLSYTFYKVQKPRREQADATLRTQNPA